MIDNIKILASGHINLDAHHAKPDGDQNVGLDMILIIMAHGFPGNQKSQLSLFPTLESVLTEKGFHCLRFDFRGCGESEGEPEDFNISAANEDYHSVLLWAREQGYERFIYIGEGLGATVSIINYNDDTANMLLLWPVLDLQYLVEKVYNAKIIEEEWKKSGYLTHASQRIGMKFIDELKALDLVDSLEKIKCPLLIMQGADDKISPADGLDLIRGHATSKRIDITSFQNGQHGLPDNQHRKTMQYHILQFVQKYV